MTIIFAAAVAAPAQRRGGRGVGPATQQSPPLARTESEKRILKTLDAIVNAGELYANVPAEDGRMLRLIAEAVNAKNVVEIGTSTGVSGLWFCLALEKTGGRLNTFEIDAGRAALARTHFQKAGVERLVNLVQGDAHENITRVKGPVDVVFIDAEKEGYVDYLNKMLPLVRPGGVILAHNIDMAREYFQAASANPDLDTVIYNGGLAITLKKR
ncbi:MAG: class I SAM-dependent methyltransferase [Acidobacteria bacterium]|nr:class I SAM-dependent methyltransferase [Acidobacteriota bacterium]